MDADVERPEKRQRLQEPTREAEDGAPPAAPPPADQISAALAKIANHVSNTSKFSKASQLLRQLIDAVDKPHRNEYFAALQAAFSKPQHCIDPLLRKDYVRLMRTVNAKSDVLSKQQRAQLEVFSIWALLRNELFTDDSFAYNKVVARIKGAISSLPEADEEQEAAWERLQQEQQGEAASGSRQQQQAAAGEPAAAGKAQEPGETELPSAAQPAAAAAADESDPFGLNEIIEREAAAAAAAAAAPPSPKQEQPEEPQQQQDAGGGGSCSKPAAVGVPWDPAALEVMRKQSLLDCLLAAKTHQHKLAWARTSVELLIEEVAKPAAQGGFADKFVGSQKQQLQELLRFVNAERAARKSGVNRRPGGKGTGEYVTSFERARAEWGSASWVSTRGKVGSQGDSKSQNWLG